MIPLVKKLDIDEINTSLIAIRKLLNNVGITETNITNIVGKDYDAKIQELEEKIEAYSIYSTTEHWTGKYWIDGKKIYSRTFVYTGLLAQREKNFDISAWNIDTPIAVVNQSAKYQSQTEPRQVLPAYGSNGEFSGFSFISTTLRFRATRFSYSWYDCIVTLEYTKTTD